MLKEHFSEKNLHHVYLIEGEKSSIFPELIEVIEKMGIRTSGNPDFYNLSFDTLKIDDSRNLKMLNYEKRFSDQRKIIIISINFLLHEAQNALLKIIEEPSPYTHFFFIVPDISHLLKTFLSRFYIIRQIDHQKNELEEAEKFVKMNKNERIEFIKKLVSADTSEEGETISVSPKSKSLKFLNALEKVMSDKILRKIDDCSYFEQILKVREFLSQPGSSAKNMMESIALIIPHS